ncbi:uncharacterized protein J8A68_002581 [[Candida] subhashii]|uniref:Uncharacterized protein n=1 Tax=[Candida] subhashii TaxID=561895 RepID=A0A8J5QP91_9ASCO|nr:uncharacterized protein J8A68_002581 [[Candida] subhashii]KAG7663893.1 hypothetical protein J8A68_002581 [[Candida] subhashii]
MSSQDNSEESSLSGTILKIPLTVEDKSTGETIKCCQLWLHVSTAEFKPSDDPQFSNISLTGIYQEGYFHNVVTKSILSKTFRKNASINVEPDDYYRIFLNLFPLDLDGLIESYESDGEHKRLKLSAKLLANKSDYDENGELLDLGDDDPNKTHITIMIKTDAKLAITVGSIDLKALEFEKQEQLQEESDLFNWLSLYNSQNEALLESLLESKKKIEKLKDDNYLLENNYNESKLDFNNIIVDMESRFYQVLDSKKDMIWELTKHAHPKDRLDQLNREYLNNEGKLNVINREEIPNKIDPKYEKKRKTSISSRGRKKRKTTKRKPTKSKKAAKEEEEDGDKSQEHSDSDEELETPPARRTRRQLAKVKSGESENDEEMSSESHSEYDDDAKITPASSSQIVEDEDMEPISPELTSGDKSTKVKEESDSHPLLKHMDVPSDQFDPRRSFRERSRSQPKVKLEKDQYSIPLRSDREIVNAALENIENGSKENEDIANTHISEDSSNQDSYNEDEAANTDYDDDEDDEEKAGADANDTQQDTQRSIETIDLGKHNSSVIEDSLPENKASISQASHSTGTQNNEEETDYSSSEDEKQAEIKTNKDEVSSNTQGKSTSQTPLSQHDHETDYSSDD